MALGPTDIERLARLARIALAPGESASFAAEMSPIFGLIDELQAVNTQGVSPLAHPLDVITHLSQPLREDRAVATDNRAENMANAPQQENGLFLVPKVIE